MCSLVSGVEHGARNTFLHVKRVPLGFPRRCSVLQRHLYPTNQCSDCSDHFIKRNFYERLMTIPALLYRQHTQCFNSHWRVCPLYLSCYRAIHVGNSQMGFWLPNNPSRLLLDTFIMHSSRDLIVVSTVEHFNKFIIHLFFSIHFLVSNGQNQSMASTPSNQTCVLINGIYWSIEF